MKESFKNRSIVEPQAQDFRIRKKPRYNSACRARRTNNEKNDMMAFLDLKLKEKFQKKRQKSPLT